MTILAWILTIVAGWPVLIVAVQCLAGCATRPARLADPDPTPPPPFAVIIPAHDEAAGIAATIALASAQLRSQDRLIVIADNCCDDTARIATGAGASVGIRHSDSHVGKAYALDFGRALLRADPPAAVVLLDADCAPVPGALQALAAAASRHDAAVQGRYLLALGDEATPHVRISTFAFLIRNAVRQRGLQRLAGLALLQGSGMAMPWRLFDTAPLASASLVEDMALGLDLALAGADVRFEDSAHFNGMVASERSTIPQRTRWEQGQLATAGAYIPRLLLAGLRRPALFALAADLSVPPLALLAMLELSAVAVVACVAVAAGNTAPLVALALLQAGFVTILYAVWSVHGRVILPLRLLLRLPLYIVWKHLIYVRFVRGRERRWIRTSRLP